MNSTKHLNNKEEVLNQLLFDICHIDHNLYKKQKAVIVKLLFHSEKYNISDEQIDLLDGLIHLLDVIDDFHTDHKDYIQEIIFDNKL